MLKPRLGDIVLTTLCGLTIIYLGMSISEMRSDIEAAQDDTILQSNTGEMIYEELIAKLISIVAVFFAVFLNVGECNFIQFFLNY